MKTLRTGLLFGCVALALSLQGCGRLEQYGESVSKSTIVPAGDILKEPDQFDGKTVTVKGKIVTECPSGCWFELAGSSGLVYVDIKPQGLAIPQRVGRQVLVQGVVKFDEGRLKIMGKGVEIQ